MSTEFRYSLTRVCLSRGQISCTQSLASLFPTTGSLKAIDTVTGDVLELTSDHSDKYKPRLIQGLGDFYRQHALHVNDTISFKVAKDKDGDKDVIHITPTTSKRKIDFKDPRALKALVETVVKSPKPLSENDIHVLYPGLPHNLDLNKLFKQDKRITKHEGHWQSTALRAAFIEANRSKPLAQASQKAQVQEEKQAVIAGTQFARNQAGTTESGESTLPETSAQLRAPNESLGSDANNHIEAFHNNSDNTFNTSVQNGSQNGSAFGLRESINRGKPAFFAPNGAETENKRNSGSGMEEIASSISGISSGTSVSVPETSLTPDKPIQFTGDYAALHKQAREKLEPLGYTVSSIEQGQLLLQTNMGRAKYTVLMYLLKDASGLNWPSALAQRRKTDADYLCILGNTNDLLNMDSPASFVRATLWSWQALDRVLEINKHIDVGPARLEPCFDETGLDTPQVDVFQNLLNKHLEEVGLFSQIIQSIASRNVPSIFVLDDIMTEVNAPRDVVVATLKTLSQIPFNLIEATDNHEFVIGKDIATGLSRLENYCASLKTNLPDRMGVDRIPASSDEPSALL